MIQQSGSIPVMVAAQGPCVAVCKDMLELSLVLTRCRTIYRSLLACVPVVIGRFPTSPIVEIPATTHLGAADQEWHDIHLKGE